jgi:hypothetical protein
MASRLNEEEIQSLVVKLQEKLNEVVVQAQEREEEKKDNTSLADIDKEITWKLTPKDVAQAVPGILEATIPSSVVVALSQEKIEILQKVISTEEDLDAALNIIGYKRVITSHRNSYCLFNSIFNETQLSRDSSEGAMLSKNPGELNMETMRLRAARVLYGRMSDQYLQNNPDYKRKLDKEVHIGLKLNERLPQGLPIEFRELIDLITRGQQVSSDILLAHSEWVDFLYNDGVSCHTFVRSPIWIIIRGNRIIPDREEMVFDASKLYFQTNTYNFPREQFRDAAAGQMNPGEVTGIKILESLINLELDMGSYPETKNKFPELLYFSGGDEGGEYTRIVRKNPKESLLAPYHELKDWFNYVYKSIYP